MSRKDFELIARTLQESKPVNNYFGDTDENKMLASAENSTWRDVCENFANILADTNARFDRYKFLKACGYSD